MPKINGHAHNLGLLCITKTFLAFWTPLKLQGLFSLQHYVDKENFLDK